MPRSESQDENPDYSKFGANYKDPINVRIYSDGMSKDFKQGFLSRVVATITLSLYTGWIHILLLMICFCWVKHVLIALVLIFSTLLLPAKPVLWSAFNKSYVFKTWREYFHFSYLYEAHIDPQKRYVYAEFPHGVFPMGPLVAGTLVQTLYPDINIYSLAASSVFQIPLWRHMIAWIGSMPATSANYRKLLRKGSVAVIVGGIAEMFMQHPRQEQVLFKGRKGFVKVAVSEGADGIIPVYHFGNTQLLDLYPRSLEKLSRKYQMALGFLYGRFGLPFPRRYPVYMVMGKPIPVQKVSEDDPMFAAVVEETHGRVLEALQQLYDTHKKEFGWENRPLVIS